VNENAYDQNAAMQSAQAVKKNFESRIMAMANVVGMGVGLVQRKGEQLQEVGLIVFVTHKLPRSMLAEADMVPREIEGVPVEVRAVGELKAQE
jgi:hypothetical protein